MNMMTGAVAINGGVGVMEVRQPIAKNVAQAAEQMASDLAVNAHITLRELKTKIDTVVEKKLPTFKTLMEKEPVAVAQTMVNGAKLTAYENGYAVYEVDGSHTVMAVDRCNDYRYDFTDGTYEVIPAETFEDVEWSVRLLMEGERRMEHNLNKRVADIFHADTEGLNFRKAFKNAGFYLSGCCIWKKNALVLGRSPYQWQHEPCLYGWKQKGKHQWYSDRKQTTIWEYDRPKSNKDHPTMKPIGLMSYPIRNSTMTNGIVLDPFLGSGSTLIACEETDRVCRGIELDPKFVDVIVKRYIEHSEGHYDDVYVIRDSQKLKFEEVATFEPEREATDGE